MTTLQDVRELGNERRNRIKELVGAKVREKLREPEANDYLKGGQSEYPRWLMIAMYVGMAVVAFAAFWISAGKQIAALDVIMHALVRDYTRLSSFWMDFGLVLFLAMSEIGVMLFLAAARLLASESRGYRVAFRLSAAVFALLALIANISVTAQEITPGYEVLSWSLTLGAPLVVMFIGLLFENIVIHTQKGRKAALDAFRAAHEQYRIHKENPELHPNYLPMYYNYLYDALKRFSSLNAVKIAELEAANPDNKKLLVKRELLADDASGWNGMENLQLPAPVSQPVLAPHVPDNGAMGRPYNPVFSASQTVPDEAVVPLGQVGQAPLKPSDKARQLLKENPGLASKTLRLLEAETGIAKSTWSRVLKEAGIGDSSASELEEAAK